MEKILNNDHITKIDEFHTSFVKNYKLSSICQVCHVKYYWKNNKKRRRKITESWRSNKKMLNNWTDTNWFERIPIIWTDTKNLNAPTNAGMTDPIVLKEYKLHNSLIWLVSQLSCILEVLLLQLIGVWEIPCEFSIRIQLVYHSQY